MILKYKDLTTEIQHTWNVKNKSDTSNYEAAGTISESFRKYLSNIPEEHYTKSRNYRQQPYWARYTYFEKY